MKANQKLIRIDAQLFKLEMKLEEAYFNDNKEEFKKIEKRMEKCIKQARKLLELNLKGEL